MVNIKKVAIIGTGFVGSSIAFALLNEEIFSEIVLIDQNKEKAEGEAMDLSHGLPYRRNMDIYVGDYKDIKDASIVILTAGANQKEGETRLDLIHKNASIIRSIIQEIKPIEMEGILLVVSNPVDILTHIAYVESGLPKNRVFGSGTVLDTARLKYLISKHLDVDAKNVHAVIIGEHGDSELVTWSIANISGIPLNEFCELRGHFNHEEAMKKLYESVRDSAYEIIKRKGATYYGVAISVAHIASCIVNNTHTMLPLSTELDGEYRVNGIALSVPSIVGRDGIEKVLEIKLSDTEQKQLLSSAKIIKEIIKDL